MSGKGQTKLKLSGNGNQCKPLLDGLALLLGPPEHSLEGVLGEAVQADPMKPKLKPPRTEPLKITRDEPLSVFAFNFNLCRHTWAPRSATPRRCSWTTRSPSSSGRGGIENKHSTVVESTPIPRERVKYCIHPEGFGKSWSNLGRVLVLTDPAVWDCVSAVAFMTSRVGHAAAVALGAGAYTRPLFCST